MSRSRPVEYAGGLFFEDYGLDRKHNKADTMVMSERRLRGKDYVGCLIQIITVLVGILSVIQGITWLLERR